MSRVKVGVIGLGFIGPVHVEALGRTGLAQVVAVCGTNYEKAKKKADELGVPRAYADYKELLADPEIEAVHICTPNNLHYQIAKEALLAGKHVVCEKPLALEMEQCDELIELGRKLGKVCAVNFNMRAYPLVQQVRDMVANGDLGEIFSVNGSYTQDWMALDTDYSWRVEPQYTGSTRTVADIGSHWFDMMEYVLGQKVKAVCADFATFYDVRKRPLKPVETYSGKLLQPGDYEEIPIETEDYSTVLFRMGDKIHGSCTTCQTMAGRKNRLYFEIAGSKGMVVWDSEKCNELWIGSREGANRTLIRDASLMYPNAAGYTSYPGGHNEGFADSMKQHMFRIYDDIINHSGASHASFEDGRRELEICNAIYESAVSEKWVTL